MDWQFKVGIGAAIAALFIPYAFKDMPVALSWAGIAFGLLFIVWGFLPGHEKMPVAPSIAIIVFLSGLIGSFRWWQDESLRPVGGVLPLQPTSNMGLVSAGMWTGDETDGSAVLRVFMRINTSAPFVTEIKKASSYWVCEEDLSTEQEHEIAQYAVITLYKIQENSPLEAVSGNQAGFYFQFEKLRSVAFKAVKDDKQRLYLFMAFSYRDSATPPDKVIISEHCIYFKKDMTQPMSCASPSRTYFQNRISPALSSLPVPSVAELTERLAALRPSPMQPQQQEKK